MRFRNKLAQAHKEGKHKVVPEERLDHAIFGAPILPISIFWIGWSSWSSVSIWSPLAGSVAFGFAVMQLYISCYQYIIDSYEIFAASALVGMTLTRYCVVSAPRHRTSEKYMLTCVYLGRTNGDRLSANVQEFGGALDSHVTEVSQLC